MSIKLNFKRIARETAIDFFAPLIVMYRLLTSDLSTASSGGQPRRAATFRQRPIPRRSSQPAGGKPAGFSREPEGASEG
ncbi:hypothetical protein ACNI65_05685 [Roseateles sp. So40a]|uniref:hypothetical protein n=1 Tax=Roseateles sp. So40a TaxID=3400226 RepID=UPI003A85C219